MISTGRCKRHHDNSEHAEKAEGIRVCDDQDAVDRTFAWRKAIQLTQKQQEMEATMHDYLDKIANIKAETNDDKNNYNNNNSNARKKGSKLSTKNDKRLHMARLMESLVLQRKNLRLQNYLYKQQIVEITRQYRGFVGKCSYAQDINDNLHGASANSGVTHDAVRPGTAGSTYCNIIGAGIHGANTNIECSVRSESQSIIKNELSDAKVQIKELQQTLTRMQDENETLKQQWSNDLHSRLESSVDKNICAHLEQKCTEKQQRIVELERLYVNECSLRRRLHETLQATVGCVTVFCRVKPFSSSGGSFEFVSFDRIVTTSVTPHLAGLSSTTERKEFTFNRVFSPNSDQQDVWSHVKPSIHSVAEGSNVCILLYGPTGSGKTYTILGSKGDCGILERSIGELCLVAKQTSNVGSFTLRVSIMEIYNDIVYDLLSNEFNTVKIWDNGSDVSLTVTECEATDLEGVMGLVNLGLRRRKTAQTKLNIRSSRSHLLIQVDLRMVSNDGCRSTKQGTLVMCDLAGSESAGRVVSKDNVIKNETCYINKSLMSLDRVFQSIRTAGDKVPFRDSKLTHILKPCLGGYAKCLLIITISQEKEMLNRSIKALQFGANAMKTAVGRTHIGESILGNTAPSEAYLRSMAMSHTNQVKWRL